MFPKKGNSFYTNEGFLCGLKQLDPRGNWLSHHPTTGWEIETPNIDEHQHIYLQDDLTYVDNKIVEFEKLVEYDPSGILIYIEEGIDIFIFTTTDRLNVAEFTLHNLIKLNK